MKLIVKQNCFSWVGSFDIYDESFNPFLIVRPDANLSNTLSIYNKDNIKFGSIEKKISSFSYYLDCYLYERYLGKIYREIKLFKNEIKFDFNGDFITGRLFNYCFELKNKESKTIAKINKGIWSFVDTFEVDADNFDDALHALIFIIAIELYKKLTAAFLIFNS